MHLFSEHGLSVIMATLLLYIEVHKNSGNSILLWSYPMFQPNIELKELIPNTIITQHGDLI